MYWLFVIPVGLYFYIVVFIARKFILLRGYRPGSHGNTGISVIIACRNEEKNLPGILNDLSAQDFNKKLYEVIVLDDHSTDRTFEIASSYKGILNLKVLRNDQPGKKNAIRKGAEKASGELIVTTDADCHAGPRWISTIASFYEDEKPELIIGPVYLTPAKGFLGVFQELEFTGLQAVTAGTAAAGIPVMCNGANLAFPASTYRDHATNMHYDLLSGDDHFFLQSLKKKKNSKVLWLESNEAVVTTATKSSLSGFLAQRARWISKAGVSSDPFTYLLGTVTFVTNISFFILTCATCPDASVIPVFGAYVLIKWIADLILLGVATVKRRKGYLLKWYIPSQIVYPLYVMAVWIISLIRRNKW